MILLGPYRTRSVNIILTEWEAYQTSRHPILCLSYWARAVEVGVMKTPLSLKEICNWLWKSRRSRYRLPLPAPHALAIPLLSHCTLKLSRNMIEAGLVASDLRSSGVALHVIVRTAGRRYKSNCSDRR
jgi:hypothetical protein